MLVYGSGKLNIHIFSKYVFGEPILGNIGFSTKDLLLLETIEKYIMDDNWNVKVAQKLRIQPTTVRIKLYKVRLKFQKSENFNEAYKKWRERLFRKSGGKWRHL